MAAHEERLGRQSVPPRGDGWEDEWEGTAPNGARAVMDRSGPKLKTRHLCGRERDSLLRTGTFGAAAQNAFVTAADEGFVY